MILVLLLLLMSYAIQAQGDDLEAFVDRDANGNDRIFIGSLGGPAVAAPHDHTVAMTLAPLSRLELESLPYPPCQSCYGSMGEESSIPACSTPSCCAVSWGGTHKYTWPELVGKDGNVAKAVIASQYKIGTAILVPSKDIVTADFCCNRIRVRVDNNNIVTKPPIIG